MAMHERRLSERKTLGQLGYIGPANNGAIVLDVSEGGLGFQAVAPVTTSRPLPFWFSADSNRIEGVGELIWIDEAKKTGGLRFTELSANSHEQIRSLLNESIPRLGDHKDTAARAFLTNGTDSHAEPRSGASPHSDISWPETCGYALWSPNKSYFVGQNPRPLGAIVVSVLAMIIAILLLRDADVRRIRPARTVGEGEAHAVAPATTPAANVSARKSKTEGAPTQASPESASTAIPSTPEASAADTIVRKSPLTGGALFVQVGAFTQEANAGKLAESLRQENFPAFIITSSNGAYYLVHVGPYRDEKSARIALSELGRAGFEPFIRH